ncbi:MAG: nucleotide exchange factor GrpE [Victivallaceae bacterium]|nr:nucleotide exchange factor GrpE [Victivallaceae bacterium]
MKHPKENAKAAEDASIKATDAEVNPNGWENAQEAANASAAAEPIAPELDVEKADPAAEELAKLKAELAELKQQLVYREADFQNYRKRTAKDITEARLIGQTNALEPFLSVYDFLGMAKTASEKSDDVASIRQGLDMILHQFDTALEDAGVKRIATSGKMFDHALHDAAAKEASDTVPEGGVVREWSGGYMLGDRLLRPARVVVSTGPEKPAEQAPAKVEEDSKEATK